MRQRHDHFIESRYFGTVRTKLGEALREGYDLKEPLPQGLVDLLGQLDARVHVCDAAEAKRDAADKKPIRGKRRNSEETRAPAPDHKHAAVEPRGAGPTGCPR